MRPRTPSESTQDRPRSDPATPSDRPRDSRRNRARRAPSDRPQDACRLRTSSPRIVRGRRPIERARERWTPRTMALSRASSTCSMVLTSMSRTASRETRSRAPSQPRTVASTNPTHPRRASRARSPCDLEVLDEARAERLARLVEDRGDFGVRPDAAAEQVLVGRTVVGDVVEERVETCAQTGRAGPSAGASS